MKIQTTMIRRFRSVLAAALLLGVPATAIAGQESGPQGLIDGPPAPVAPAVINRDDNGRVTIRATRVETPLHIDGALDEALYREVEPVTGFTQIEPQPGAAATDRTELWVAFDDKNIYYAFRCYDTDTSKLVATELRRDNNTIFSGNDVAVVIFDTFYDRRNAFGFIVNPRGGRMDGQITNNRQFSSDFNPIWELKTGRFDGGWTLEAAIPFKSLRYKPGRSQVWGFNAMRAHPAKNEIAFLSPRMPPGRGRAGMMQASLAATVVGIEAPPPSGGLDIKPYVTSSMTSDTTVRPRVSNDPDATIGADVKYPLTQGLSVDATFNTDFAQVEADEQQINLTRFSLFFPEKRDFFLENQGLFSFGGITNTTSGDAPILFYSRRIGLNQGRLVPLNVGGRVTGRVGKYTLGIADMQTGEETVSKTGPTNFSVVRIKRDILRRSAVGLIASGRTRRESGVGSNQTFGIDGTFTFYTNVNINTYWAKTITDGIRGQDASYRAQLDYPADRYGVQLERMNIGDNFNPEIGFVRRDNITKQYAQLRFSPRLNIRRPISRTIRKFWYSGAFTNFENGSGRLESRNANGEFAIEFANGDRFSVDYNGNYEFLPAPFRITPSVTLPIGGYHFDDYTVAFNMGVQRMHAANFSIEKGEFYNGHRTVLSAAKGRLQASNGLSFEPTYTMNRVELVQGAFTTHLGGSRITYTMTPLMFASALLQYNSSSNSVSVNARLRWEYRPGSEIFLVYNESRDTHAANFPQLANRALIFKINRLMRF